MNVVTRGIRNAFRNSIRTASLVLILGLSIGLALSMVIARQAVQTKIESVKSTVGNTISISPAGVRGFEGGGTALTQDIINKVKSVAHVTTVNTALTDRLTSSNSNLQSAIEAGSLGQRFANNDGTAPAPPMDAGNQSGAASTAQRTFTPPVTVLGTTTPTNLSNTQGGGTFTLVSGKVFEPSSTANEAVVGKALADKNNLSVGSTFTAYEKPITVIGIYDSGNTFSNNQVLMPLTTLQTLSGQAGSITAATIGVDSVSNVDGATSAISTLLGTTADVTNGAEQAKTAVEPLQNIATISFYSLVGAVVAGAVIILLTMIMIVRERRREIGVLKAIGASNVRVMFQFMSEAVTLTLMAAAVGTLLSLVAAQPITKALVNNASSTATTTAGRGVFRGPGMIANRIGLSNIQTTIGWSVLLYGLLAAIVIALAGSAAAAFLISKIRPAEVMRAE